ncbi:centromere protein T isoform X4 [Phacochoerus africanus]|uniref:centromere protein T isoform X4 n=1 Tax=Phacochoerus africanus TaxID=41426 RepID=UPI001FD9DC90|nr:centromere protein T isoform X4 [Phacochoerus africanus]
MADSHSPDSEPTTRTLLRRVLDTADPRTPRRPRSARIGCWSLHSAQISPLETSSSRRLRSQTKMSARRWSHRIRSIDRLAHVQASGHLEEQTPRTLLKNILLTAPESSTVMPESMMKPLTVPQMVQPSRRESSWSSLELQLPELEPPTTLAPGLLASGRRKQKLRLSVFQQGMDQELPLSQESRGNADASSLTSSLNLTFATPLQPLSVKRPGLARRPLTRRAVDVGTFFQDLRDTSLALPPPDTVLEDTQPFSQPLAGHSPSVRHSLPCPPHSGAKELERADSRRTLSGGPGPQNNGPGEPAQLLAGKVEEAAAAAVGFPNASSSISGEDGVEPLQNRVASPELASSTPEFLQARRLQVLEPALLPSTAVLPSEPAQPLLARLPPRPRIAGPRPRPDPYKAGLNHYAKLFSFYAKMPMERKAVEMVEECLDKYFQHLCGDLEAFAAHAGRKTVRPEDVELLLRRQGLVTDQVSLHVLVERHLPLEYRQLLIPCAFSGNSVFPAQ